MILNEITKVKIGTKNIRHYLSLGYNLPHEKASKGRLRVKKGLWLEVKTSDIPKGSAALIDVKCEYCGRIRKTENFALYVRKGSNFKKNGTTPCIKCFLTKVNVGKNNPQYIHGNIRFPEYRNNAKRRGIKFNLSIKEFEGIVSKPCHYCSGFSKDRNIHSRGNGIDRKDSNNGYEVNNCVPCCATCNFIKNNMGYKDFINYIKSVYKTIKKYEV